MSSVRPIDRILSVVNVARGLAHSGKYVAFCIAHDDRNTPNLHVEEDEDRNVLLWCSAGCSQEQVLAALEERGVSRPDLFADRNEAGGGGIDLPPKSAATLQPRSLFREKEAADRVASGARPLGCALHGGPGGAHPLPQKRRHRGSGALQARFGEGRGWIGQPLQVAQGL